jgi:hypothetical protein
MKFERKAISYTKNQAKKIEETEKNEKFQPKHPKLYGTIDD